MSDDRLKEIRTQFHGPFKFPKIPKIFWGVDDVGYLLSIIDKQQRVVDAALSVCSEDSVKSELQCYNMGIELLNSLQDITAQERTDET